MPAVRKLEIDHTMFAHIQGLGTLQENITHLRVRYARVKSMKHVLSDAVIERRAAPQAVPIPSQMLGLLPPPPASGWPDSFELALGLDLDCNGNLVPDSCDIADGTSSDCDQNGIPDECDLAVDVDADCDGNGILDVCDVLSGAAFDCNGNTILDSCDIRDGYSTD